jgi:hypothetical protein
MAALSEAGPWRNALAAPRPLRKDFYLKRGQCGFSEEEIPQSKERLAATVERPASGICDRPRKARRKIGRTKGRFRPSPSSSQPSGYALAARLAVISVIWA